jgi:hypothetical protein
VVSPPFQAIVYGAVILAIFNVEVPSLAPLHEMLVDCILADKLETKLTSGKLVTTGVLSAVNGCDSTITTNLTLLPDVTSTSNESVCYFYSWNGVTYLASGSYTYSTTNANGCDSTATLNLTINNSTTSTTNDAICNSYNWNGPQTQVEITVGQVQIQQDVILQLY